MTSNATMLQAGEGRSIWQLGNRFTVKSASEQTQGRYALLEQVCAGAPPPMHVHDNEEEAFYVLSGTLDLYVGDDVHQVEAGTFCLVPRGTRHSFVSTSVEPARMLVVLSPAGFEQFFAEVENRFPEADGIPSPDVVGPALGELASRYGLQIVGPPPQGRAGQ